MRGNHERIDHDGQERHPDSRITVLTYNAIICGELCRVMQSTSATTEEVEAAKLILCTFFGDDNFTLRLEPAGLGSLRGADLLRAIRHKIRQSDVAMRFTRTIARELQSILESPRTDPEEKIAAQVMLLMCTDEDETKILTHLRQLGQLEHALDSRKNVPRTGAFSKLSLRLL
jgi:hypothetical protein